MASAVPSINTSALESIQDRNVRNVLKQIIDGWQVRNGQSGSGDNAFLTIDSLKDQLKKSPLADAVADAVAKSGSRAMSDAYSPVKPLIDMLQTSVLSDPFFNKLGERVAIIDAPNGTIDTMRKQVDDALGKVKSGIVSLNDLSQDSKSVTARTLFALKSQVDDPITGLAKSYAMIGESNKAFADFKTAYATKISAITASIDKSNASIANESNVRVNSDNAIASAINTIWAAVGDSSSLIQDGGEALATRSGAVANKWQQIQAALVDPVTGKVMSSAVARSEYAAVADKVKGLSASYALRIDLGGFVSGFGLAAESDVNGNKSSRFYIRANKFAIGSPSDIVDPTTGESTSATVPFIVTTNDSIINGKSVPAGVYMSRAMIANGSIDSLAVGDAAIDTAHIKDLSVNTLKLGDNTVTIPIFMNGSGGSMHGSGQPFIRIGYVIAQYKQNVNIVALASWNTVGYYDNAGTELEIRVDGVKFVSQNDSVIVDFGSSHVASGKITLAGRDNPYLIEVFMRNDWSGGAFLLRQWSVTLLGVMK